MEADWEIEIGGDAPVIEALWPGFIDLRQNPQLAMELPESEQLPALAEALVLLNAAASPVWTAKCDVWPVIHEGGFDRDELDAPVELAQHAFGCYIDLLPRNPNLWSATEVVASACREICGRLKGIQLRCCRVDLVVRKAVLAPNRLDLGVSAYLTACGSTATDAIYTLQDALAVFAAAIPPEPSTATAPIAAV